LFQKSATKFGQAAHLFFERDSFSAMAKSLRLQKRYSLQK